MNALTKWMPDPVRQRGRYCLKRYQHQTARVYPRPVLIGGSQKSGTTAIGALLAQATGLRYSNDPFWHALRYDSSGYLLPEFLENRLTIDQFVDRHRAYFAAEIIKCPDFAYLFPQLRSRFPDCRQVFIVRDPRQNIRSLLNRLRIPGDLAQLGPEQHQLLADKPAWRGIVAGDGLALAKGNYVSRLAQRWKLAAQCYLRERATVQLIHYEDFLADKQGCIDRLATRLGLAVVNDIRAELNRQYQPAGNRNVALDAFFGERNLDTIETVCGPEMAALGYR